MKKILKRIHKKHPIPFFLAPFLVAEGILYILFVVLGFMSEFPEVTTIIYLLAGVMALGFAQNMHEKMNGDEDK